MDFTGLSITASATDSSSWSLIQIKCSITNSHRIKVHHMLVNMHLKLSNHWNKWNAEENSPVKWSTEVVSPTSFLPKTWSWLNIQESNFMKNKNTYSTTPPNNALFDHVIFFKPAWPFAIFLLCHRLSHFRI